MLSLKEISIGAPKICLNANEYDTSSLGKYVTISDMEYEVIGLSANDNIISYFSLKESVSPTRINIILDKPFKTAEEKEAFKDDLYSIFEGSQIVAPESDDTKSIFDFAPMMLPTIILILLGFINLSFLYIYFIKIRRNQYAVYRISGASIYRIFGLFVAEILLLFTAAFAISLLIFKITAAKIAIPDSVIAAAFVGATVSDRMSLLRCAAVYGILASLFILSFIPIIIKTLRSDITVNEENRL